jgi:TonB family protein
MQEAVSTILIDRAREVEGINRMVLLSLIAHAAIVTAVVLMPSSWRTGAPKAEPVRMVLSFGGSPGPKTGGNNPIANRPVQAVAPPEAKPSPVVPPAAKTPDMVIPDKPARTTAKNSAVKAPDKSASRKVTTGPEVKSGAARVETGGAQIPFGGLSTTGGGGTGGVRLDVANFCCPEYIITMVQRIREHWNERPGGAGEVTVKYTIRADGMLTQVEVEKTSGNPLLDLESRRAVLMTRQLPPLPREFTQSALTVHLIFEYKR